MDRDRINAELDALAFRRDGENVITLEDAKAQLFWEIDEERKRLFEELRGYAGCEPCEFIAGLRLVLGVEE